jgi:hypothetical protein
MNIFTLIYPSVGFMDQREESDSKTSLVPKPYTAHANTRRKERNQMSESSRESADLVGEELWMGCGRWKTRKPPVFTRTDNKDIDLVQLLLWCRKNTKHYEDVNVIDFYQSWEDGLAFCAILHSLLPEKIPFDELSRSYPHLNFSIAIKAAK